VEEGGEWGERVDEGARFPAHAGFADSGERAAPPTRRPDKRIPADRVARKILTFLGVFLGRNRLRRDVLVRKHAIDRAPIGVVDNGVAIVIFRFRLTGAANHLADRVDLDVASEALRRALDLGDLLRITLERGARTRGRHE